MKKWLALICILSSFNAVANEYICSSDDDTLSQFEQALDNCKIDYGSDFSTNDMLKAYTDAENCLTNVAYKIFDKYYVTYNKQSKTAYEQYVTAIKLFSSNLIQNSDWAKTHHAAEVYTLQAEGLVYALMEDTLKEYIKELRYECIEKDELRN